MGAKAWREEGLGACLGIRRGCGSEWGSIDDTADRVVEQRPGGRDMAAERASINREMRRALLREGGAEGGEDKHRSSEFLPRE